MKTPTANLKLTCDDAAVLHAMLCGDYSGLDEKDRTRRRVLTNKTWDIFINLSKKVDA